MYRAVIYCRCSTDEESQKDALRKQVKEAENLVRRKGWLLMDSYVESRSGTSTKGRSEYNRLYEDLLKDSFDIVVIKSQDRLMRNTKDWYLFIDRLTTSGKRLYIYIEQKFYSADDGLITGIKAILAEDYSRELSKKMNHAHRSRQKSGGAVILTSHTYGYRKLADKTVVIDEEEAKVKRRMYELCAAGYGSRRIAAILREDGVVNRKGSPFSDSDIRRMIRNPLNKGTVVMNRQHYDFETKKTRKVPKDQQYVHENLIPAIVSEPLWEAANREIDKRAAKAAGRMKETGGGPAGKSPLSGKVSCGLCEKTFYRCSRKNSQGIPVHEWKCSHYLAAGRDGCENVFLEEEKLERLLEEICSQYYLWDREKAAGEMTRLLKTVLAEQDFQRELQEEERKLKDTARQMDVLADKLLAGVIPDEIYKKKQGELESKRLKSEERAELLRKQAGKESRSGERIVRMERILRTGSAVCEAAVRAMLEETERIVVFPGYMEIIFRTDSPSEGCPLKIRREYGNTFRYLAGKREERETILRLLQKKPRLTVRQTAEAMGISYSKAAYSFDVLKREGRLQFGKEGWKVLQTEKM